MYPFNTTALISVLASSAVGEIVGNGVGIFGAADVGAMRNYCGQARTYSTGTGTFYCLQSAGKLTITSDV